MINADENMPADEMGGAGSGASEGRWRGAAGCLPTHGGAARRLTAWATWAASNGLPQAGIDRVVGNVFSYLPETPRADQVRQAIRARVAVAADVSARLALLREITPPADLIAEAKRRAAEDDDAYRVARAVVRATNASAIEATAAALAALPGEDPLYVLSGADGAALARQAAVAHKFHVVAEFDDAGEMIHDFGDVYPHWREITPAAEQDKMDRERRLTRAAVSARDFLASLPPEADRAAALASRYDLNTRDAEKLARAFSISDEPLVEPEPEPEPMIQPPTPAPAPLDLRPRLRSVSYSADAELTLISWLVKGLFPRTGLAMLVGESSAGKTFLAVLLALCVAYGLPFFGRRTKQGGVIFVAAEAGASVLTRLRAAERALQAAVNAMALTMGHAPTRAPIVVVTEAPNLSKGGSTIPFAATIEDAVRVIHAAGHEPGLLAIDTLHASMGGGDENSAADAAAVLNPVRQIAEQLGCLGLFLHHPGKDTERGARGSSAFRAAMDAEISLEAVGCVGARAKATGALRRATVTKMRDGEAGGSFAYRLNVVEVGQDEDGEPLTTCTVEPVVEPALDEDGLSGTDRDLMAAFDKTAVDGRGSTQELRQAFYARRPKSGPEANRKAYGRAFAAALKAGRLGTDANEWSVWRGDLEP